MVTKTCELQYLNSHNQQYKLNVFLIILSFIVQVKNMTRALIILPNIPERIIRA